MPASLLRRRRGHRRGRQRRRRHDHGELPPRPKNRTTIGEGAKTGVHNSFIAPVSVGDAGVHWRRIGDHDDVPGRRARDRPIAVRRTSRATPSASRNERMTSLDVDTRTHAPTSLEVGYDKRMMVVAGRASQELGGRIADKLGVHLTDAGLKTFADGEVYCRFAESIRGADVFLVQSIVGNEREGLTVNDALMELLVMIDAAVGASRAPRDRRDPLVRLLAPGQEVRAARADHRAAGGEDARARRHRPALHHGPARRPGPGLLREDGRPHDGFAGAGAVRRGPARAAADS